MVGLETQISHFHRIKNESKKRFSKRKMDTVSFKLKTGIKRQDCSSMHKRAKLHQAINMTDHNGQKTSSVHNSYQHKHC